MHSGENCETSNRRGDGIYQMKQIFSKLAWVAVIAGTLLPTSADSKRNPVTPSVLGKLVSVTTIKEKQIDFNKAVGSKGLVVAFTSTSCPVTKRQLANLALLEDAYRAKGIPFIYVNPVDTDTLTSVKQVITSEKLDGHYVFDHTKSIQSALKPKTTAEVFVFNNKRALVYRGAADDQYGVTHALPKPRNQWLKWALNDLCAGKTSTFKFGQPSGCALETPAIADASATSYYGNVAHIIQKNCVSCHQTGGIAPFKLDTLADFKAHAGQIKQSLEQGTMPPWQAAPMPNATANTFSNDCSLRADEKSTILTWMSGNRPLGNIQMAPKPLPPVVDGWVMGKPDLIVQMPEAIRIPATGIMPYRIMDAQVNITEDKWVQSVEVRPSARQVVHHVLIYVRKPGQFSAEDLSERASYFATYAPGTGTASWPDGLAKKLPKGSVLRFQLHYTPNGTAFTDQTRLGIRYAKRAPDHEVKVSGASNTRFRIPAGDPNYKVISAIPIPMDIKVTALMPHMHVRGKAAKFELVMPDGSRKLLLDVPRYDFNWQHTYRYIAPLDVPKNSRLEFSCWFDNSTGNKNNPDPTRNVPWGPQTFDEMQLGYFEYYAVAKDETGDILDEGASADSMLSNMFSQLDKNSDGVVTPDEFPNAIFNLLDKDKDGKVTRDEAKLVMQFIGGRGLNGGAGGLLGGGGRGLGLFGGQRPPKP